MSEELDGFHNRTRALEVRFKGAPQKFLHAGILRRPTSSELQGGMSIDARIYTALMRDLNLISLVSGSLPKAFDES